MYSLQTLKQYTPVFPIPSFWSESPLGTVFCFVLFFLFLLYRHILFCCALLYRALQILSFLQIEGLWQPCLEQVYKCHFFNSVCSFCVCVIFW